MYEGFLHLHNLLRWVVLILAVVAIVMTWAGVRSRSPWEGSLKNVGRFLGMAFNLQVVVGLLLYAWLSPLTTGAFNNIGGAMGNTDLRFYLVEHLLLMVVATGLVHVGSARGQKTGLTLQPAIFYTIALALVLAGIPWDRAFFPGM